MGAVYAEDVAALGAGNDGDSDGDGQVGILDLGALANDYGKMFP